MSGQSNHERRLTFRRTTSADLAGIVALEASPDTSEWLAETGRGWHVRALRDVRQEHWIAELDGVPIGFVVVAGLEDLSLPVELRRIVVSTRHRGAGLGREIIRWTLAYLYGVVGAQSVWLDVKPDNRRAIELYRSEGFTKVRTIPEALLEPDGTKTDLVVLMAHAPNDDAN